MTAYHEPVKPVVVEPLVDRLLEIANSGVITLAGRNSCTEAVFALEAKDATINYLRGQLLKEKT
jgi:hypothetical protein